MNKPGKTQDPQAHVWGGHSLRQTQGKLCPPMPAPAQPRSSVPHTFRQLQPQSITIQAVARPSRKRRGEAAEAAFLARATSLGFRISKPWGEAERYDLVVDYGKGFYRVQVKCTERYAESRYRVKNGGHSDAVYTSDEIDFIAAHVVPLDLWYIIPIEAAGSRKGLRFYPHDGRKALFEKYREAWCLLDCTRKLRGRKDIPIRCRCRELEVRCALCPLRR